MRLEEDNKQYEGKLKRAVINGEGGDGESYKQIQVNRQINKQIQVNRQIKKQIQVNRQVPKQIQVNRLETKHVNLKNEMYVTKEIQEIKT